MVTQVVVHLLPQEIDWFEWQSRQFKIGSAGVNGDVIIDVTLNLNLVDWSKSLIPSQFFIEKFNQIKSLWDWAEDRFTVSDCGKCLGANDKRRSSILTTEADNILWLDTDIIFRPELLSYMVKIANIIPDEYYILSPQIGKLWDNSWDVLVNSEYVNKAPSQEYKEYNPFDIVYEDYGDVTVGRLDRFKLAAGWFNLISANLLKLTDVPEQLGPYGLDDTYLMCCCDILKDKGHPVQQYVVKNTVIAENIKYRNNPYTNYLHLIDRKDEFRNIAESNLYSEVIKFKTKYDN
jgi:hypothetical protein